MCYTFTIQDANQDSPHASHSDAEHVLKIRDTVDDHTAFTNTFGFSTEELTALYEAVAERFTQTVREGKW